MPNFLCNINSCDEFSYRHQSQHEQEYHEDIAINVKSIKK
ncbi:hypothetical protein FJQ89_13870 [Janthinobacterium tructae]|uniref:Uncharacterized protein n=1 Tax=Janthinobacterium tructae TaxID=2590869 RepID=A0A4Y6RFJ7_9BURK|nr:hypothetical protein FJQ89_13870 [Janthinobacterium tructae]